MNTILGIEIPTDLGALSPDDLKTLASDLRAAAKAKLAAGDITPEVLAEIKSARAKADEFKEAGDAKVAEQKAFEDEVAAEAAALADEADAEADADSDEPDDDAEDDAEDADDSADEAEGDADEAVTAGAGWRPTAKGVAKSAPADKARPAKAEFKSPSKAFTATTGVKGKDAGDQFASGAELGEALMETFRSMSGGGAERRVVGKTFATFSPEQELTEDMAVNYAKFGGIDPMAPDMDAITAAICAPAEPLYELATTSSTARPVKGSLAVYRPARGNVSVYPTPKLADIDDGPGGNGRGIWTQANDADANAVKEACARIACATPDVYGIYGIYRCMTIKNMMAMTFPELVEAYLNRLGALTARMAEEALLDAMVGSPNTKAVTVDASANGFDASINLWTTILNLVAVYREEERYGDQQFDAWLPRWTVPALQIGLVRQRRTSGQLSERLPSQREIESVLRTAGIDMTWTMDDAASWTPVTYTGDDGDALPELPTDLSFVVSPKGNFRALDRGELNIGVATGNIYRDNVSNSKNEFTIFQENFEGLMDFGATSYAVDLTGLCYNGAQTADVTAIECAGS